MHRCLKSNFSFAKYARKVMVNSHDYRKHTNVDSNWGPCPISGRRRRLEDVGNILQELHDNIILQEGNNKQGRFWSSEWKRILLGNYLEACKFLENSCWMDFTRVFFQVKMQQNRDTHWEELAEAGINVGHCWWEQQQEQWWRNTREATRDSIKVGNAKLSRQNYKSKNWTNSKPEKA